MTAWTASADTPSGDPDVAASMMRSVTAPMSVAEIPTPSTLNRGKGGGLICQT
jgi:hypothetical protein